MTDLSHPTCEWCESPATVKIVPAPAPLTYMRYACDNEVHRDKTRRLVLLDHGGGAPDAYRLSPPTARR